MLNSLRLPLLCIAASMAGQFMVLHAHPKGSFEGSGTLVFILGAVLCAAGMFYWLLTMFVVQPNLPYPFAWFAAFAAFSFGLGPLLRVLHVRSMPGGLFMAMGMVVTTFGVLAIRQLLMRPAVIR
jgi:hypothetical protein